MKLYLSAFLTLWIITGCAPKNSKPEATATKYTAPDESPLPPSIQHVSPDTDIKETVFYASVITDSPNSAVKKLTEAFKPMKGRSYEVEVRVISQEDNQNRISVNE